MYRSWILLLLLLAACATNVPDAIREPPPDNLAVDDVRRDPETYVGPYVRWGGTIAGVENGKTETTIEIVARDLDSSGRPRLTDHSPGRFLARAAGFLDPAVYSKGREVTVTGTHLLAAAGRTPNTDTLDLEAAGVAVDRAGFVVANERLETNVEGIYALGDVKGGPQFTHISYDDYRIVKANLLDGASATTRDRLVPYTVFIDPQLGRVGLSEGQARKEGRKIRVAKMPMDYVARADETDEKRGFMKAVVDAETGQILGCAILGIEGGELMAMLEIAMLGQVPYPVLREAIFAHPTLAESLNNLFNNFTDEAE